MGYRLVASSSFVDVLLCDVCDLLFLRDLVCEHLGGLQHIHCLFIVEDLALRGRQDFQCLVLKLLKLALILRTLCVETCCGF